VPEELLEIGARMRAGANRVFPFAGSISGRRWVICTRSVMWQVVHCKKNWVTESEWQIQEYLRAAPGRWISSAWQLPYVSAFWINPNRSSGPLVLFMDTLEISGLLRCGGVPIVIEL